MTSRVGGLTASCRSLICGIGLYIPERIERINAKCDGADPVGS